MAVFTSWADELERFKNAIARRSIDSYFVSAIENSREMRTMYTKLKNIQGWLEWLKMKAANEAISADAGGSSNPMLMALGGGS